MNKIIANLSKDFPRFPIGDKTISFNKSNLLTLTQASFKNCSVTLVFQYVNGRTFNEPLSSNDMFPLLFGVTETELSNFYFKIAEENINDDATCEIFCDLSEVGVFPSNARQISFGILAS